MNNLYVFDLKDTLVKSDQTMNVSIPELLSKLQESGDAMLYSIYEPWTFEVLAKYERVFKRFSKVILVSAKKTEDLRLDFSNYKRVVVIGDDPNGEIRIAKELGLKSVLVDESMATADFLQKINEALR